MCPSNTVKRTPGSETKIIQQLIEIIFRRLNSCFVRIRGALFRKGFTDSALTCSNSSGLRGALERSKRSSERSLKLSKNLSGARSSRKFDPELGGRTQSYIFGKLKHCSLTKKNLCFLSAESDRQISFRV